MSMGDFYAIAKEFGTPCQPGDDLSEAVARVLTEVMRRLMDDDAPEREWVTGPTLVAADLTPPEPALRVGDFVRDRDGFDCQIIKERGLTNCHGLTRIEPPVGWPVGVPDDGVPGGVLWYRSGPVRGSYYCTSILRHLSWAELVAAGGIPALAPEPTP